jgi:hypothetical protein
MLSETQKEKLSGVLLETLGERDEQGQLWTDRKLEFPNREIRIGTCFSGLGAPEMALRRLGLITKHVYACDIGERFLKYSMKQLRVRFVPALKTDKDRETFVDELIKSNKGIHGLTKDNVSKNLYGGETTLKGSNYELPAWFLNHVTENMSPDEKERYITSLYDEFGDNLVKAAYMANYDLDEKDYYTDIRFVDFSKYRGKVDLIVGGSPCVSYSIAGKKLGLEDTRGTLFYDLARSIKQVQPKVFIYENVSTMLKFGNGEKSGLQAAVEVFQSIGYCVKWQILDGADYGKPTHRERVWLVGFKNEFLFPKEIPLTTRLYDYLDEDKLPKSGHVDKPFVREMTGTECLRIIGFEDFKTPEKVKNMKNGDEFLAKCAGNSMVVDCLMAIYKQLDISKYGVETETKSELNLDNSTLEAMSVSELSDLITRASSILNQKLQPKTEPTTDTDPIKTETVEPTSSKTETVDEGVDYDKILPSMLLDDIADKTDDEVLKIKGILPPMDFSGKPTNQLEQVGNDMANDDETKNLTNPQWGRIYSINGCAPTLTHFKPPKILITNEVSTTPNPEVIEVEPPHTPNPLW